MTGAVLRQAEGMEVPARLRVGEGPIRPLDGPSGIDWAFAAALQQRVSAVTVTSDALFAAPGTLGRRHRMPTIFTYCEFVAASGLAGYSGSRADTAHISGVYAGRILQGESQQIYRYSTRPRFS